MVKVATPKPPDGMSKSSKSIWRAILKGFDLDAAGLMLLTSALSARDRLMQAEEILADEGLVLLDRFGQARPHPLLKCEVDSRNALLANIKALGLDIEPLHDRPGRPGKR